MSQCEIFDSVITLSEKISQFHSVTIPALKCVILKCLGKKKKQAFFFLFHWSQSILYGNNIQRIWNIYITCIVASLYMSWGISALNTSGTVWLRPFKLRYTLRALSGPLLLNSNRPQDHALCPGFFKRHHRQASSPGQPQLKNSCQVKVWGFMSPRLPSAEDDKKWKWENDEAAWLVVCVESWEGNFFCFFGFFFFPFALCTCTQQL